MRRLTPSTLSFQHLPNSAATLLKYVRKAVCAAVCSPCFSEFREERALPAAVHGPVDRRHGCSARMERLRAARLAGVHSLKALRAQLPQQPQRLQQSEGMRLEPQGLASRVEPDPLLGELALH